MRHIGEAPDSDESVTGSRRSVLRVLAGAGAAAVGGLSLAGEAVARDRDCPPPLGFVGVYGGDAEEAVYSVVESADGGYALGGTRSDPFGEAPSDAWTATVDASGDVERTNTYGGEGFDVIRSVVRTDTDGYGYLGNSGSSDGKNADAWLFETDADGNVLRSRTYGGSGYDTVQSGIRTADGGYAMAGDGTGAAPGTAYLLKTDSTGEIAWSRTYGIDRPYTYTSAEALVRADDGGYAFVGRKTRLEGNLDPNDDIEPTIITDAWLVKTDAAGAVEWTGVYDGNGSDWPHSLVTTRDGGYAFAGTTGGPGKEDSGFPDEDALLVRVDGD